MLCVLRPLFVGKWGRTREESLRELAAALGFQRLGNRVRNELLADLTTAVRRGILKNENGLLSPDCRTIADYPRDFLKTQLLAAIGSTWVTRKDAATLLARHLGFARTGPAIAETARSLINGLIRTGGLHAEGREIRRA